MEIAPSARKHGVSDKDMRHAARNMMRIVPQDQEDRVFIIGADGEGRLLEVIVLDPDGDEPVIIHAKKLRRKFYRYL